MIRKKFYLVFNLNDGSTIETGFKVVQNDVDAYTINAVIFDGSAPIDYELISSATITYEKPDGKIVQRDMTVESNMITCIVKSNEISVLGVVKASIQLYGEDDERLSLLPFTFEVTKDMISPPVVESTNEFPILQKLVQDVHTIIPMLPEIQQIAFEMPGIIEFFDTAEISEAQRVASENTRQAQEAARQASIADIINQFNNLVTAKQQEAEVIIARDGEANLKARLDRDKQELSSQLAEKSKQEILMSEYAIGDGTDETLKIQEAINASVGKTLIWTKQSGSGYVTNPLFLPSNIHIIFQPGTLVKSKTGYNTNDRLFTALGSDNIIIEGNFATIQMLKSEYTTGQQRHAFWLIGNENVIIKDLIVKDSGGDGFCIGGAQTLLDTPKMSKNIKIINCTIDNNRRQGISIIGHVSNILIDGNTITNTNGTEPQSAIDIESNSLDFDNNDIIIKNNMLINNTRGILVYDNSYNIQIFNNTLINSASIQVSRKSANSPTPTVKVYKNVIKDSNTVGIYVNSCSKIEISDNVILNPSSHGIYIQSVFANLAFDNIIARNNIKGSLQRGINLDGCLNSFVKDNFITDCVSSGIAILTGSNNTKVENNIILDCAKSSSEYGIRIISSSDCKLKGNKISKGAGLTLYGIYADNNSLRTVVEGNDLYLSGDIEVYSVTPTVIIKENKWNNGATSPLRTSSLPQPSSGYLGSIIILKTIDEDDKIYMCITNASGAYVWKLLNLT